MCASTSKATIISPLMLKNKSKSQFNSAIIKRNFCIEQYVNNEIMSSALEFFEMVDMVYKDEIVSIIHWFYRRHLNLREVFNQQTIDLDMMHNWFTELISVDQDIKLNMKRCILEKSLLKKKLQEKTIKNSTCRWRYYKRV